MCCGLQLSQPASSRCLWHWFMSKIRRFLSWGASGGRFLQQIASQFNRMLGDSKGLWREFKLRISVSGDSRKRHENWFFSANRFARIAQIRVGESICHLKEKNKNNHWAEPLQNKLRDVIGVIQDFEVPLGFPTAPLYNKACQPRRTENIKTRAHCARSRCTFVFLLDCPFSLSLSMSLSLPRSPSLPLSRHLSLYLATSLSISLHVFLSRSLSLTLSPPLSVSLYIYLSLSLYISLSLSPPLSFFSVSISLSVYSCIFCCSPCASLSLSISLSLSLSLSPPLSLTLTHSLSLSISLSLSVSLSLSLSLSVSLSLSISLSPFLSINPSIYLSPLSIYLPPPPRSLYLPPLSLAPISVYLSISRSSLLGRILLLLVWVWEYSYFFSALSHFLFLCFLIVCVVFGIASSVVFVLWLLIAL